MEQYIALRDFFYLEDVSKPTVTKSIEKRNILTIDETRGVPDSFAGVTMKLDIKIFNKAFFSFGYMNWLKEFAREIDVDGNPLYPKLTKSVETVILYLKDLGVPTAFILKAMLAQEEYLNFLIQVDEFGKTVIE